MPVAAMQAVAVTRVVDHPVVVRGDELQAVAATQVARPQAMVATPSPAAAVHRVLMEPVLASPQVELAEVLQAPTEIRTLGKVIQREVPVQARVIRGRPRRQAA